MEIPLTEIHNRISIRQAGLHGYNDYFQSIALKDEKSIFWKRCSVLLISASKTLFKMEKNGCKGAFSDEKSREGLTIFSAWPVSLEDFYG